MTADRLRLARIVLALAGVALVGAIHLTRLHRRADAAAPVLLAAPLPVGALAAPTAAEVEQAWRQATPLAVQLVGGEVGSIQVRAVYSTQSVYFRLRWPEPLSNLPEPTVQQQQATVTWKRAQTIGGCAVACHVSFSSGRRIDNMQLVTPDVTAAPFTVLLDQWRDGWWTLGYSRPLVTSDVEDIQFVDLRRAYPFGLDVAEGPGSAHTHGEALTLRFAAA